MISRSGEGRGNGGQYAPGFLEGRTAGFWLLWLALGCLATAIYWPALGGPFYSDDLLYVVSNPWVANPSPQAIWGILNPLGDARLETANYAPLHLLLTMGERVLFWDEPFGYHVINIILHALNSSLLVLLLVRTGLPTTWSLVGGVVMLVHPGNVEAVAWITQIKTLASMTFALGALLLASAYPARATMLFVLGLLTKASAASVLPVAFALRWVGKKAGVAESRGGWNWLIAWAVLFALYSVPQYTAMHPRGLVFVEAYDDLWVHLLSMASIGAHYLVMAFTGLGLSHGHEHLPVTTALNPWVVGALFAVVFFTWRIGHSLMRGTPEGAYWLWAAAAFLPVSQWLPFDHPIADRYLYFEFPGLIGGTFFLCTEIKSNVGQRIASLNPRLPVFLGRAGLVALFFIVFFFASTSLQRSPLWSDPILLMVDSATNYPSGRTALRLKAAHAAEVGDAYSASDFLRQSVDLGANQLSSIALDPSFESLYFHPEFQELIEEMATGYIDLLESRPGLTQTEMAALAGAYFQRGEPDRALEILTEAHDQGGFLAPHIASELDLLRALLRASQ